MLKLKKESFHMEHAGFWKRLVAIIIDTLVLVLFNFLLGFSLVFCAILLGIDEESLRSQGIQLGFEFIGVIIQTCYFILMESSSIQATLGKLAMGIFVCDGNGNRLTIGRAALRYFGKIPSAILLGIGFLMAAFTENKQALHDKIAKCYVMSK
jgi:uncharacterized RDD family membrane protein YckC